MQHDLDIQAIVAPQKESSLFRAAAVSDSDAATSTANFADTQILADVLGIHEYERQRFAQELHDSAGQLVVALQLSVAHLRRVEKDSSHDSLIEEIQGTVRQIDQEIRSIAFLSYPVELLERSLCSALESLALGFGRRTGIRTTFRWVGDQSPLDEAVSKTILRVAQEALVNIHRHSRASAARVFVKRHPESLRLTVSDNGVGFHGDRLGKDPHGIGVQGMRHRIEELGGHFQMRNLRQGACVSAVAPVPTAG